MPLLSGINPRVRPAEISSRSIRTFSGMDPAKPSKVLNLSRSFLFIPTAHAFRRLPRSEPLRFRCGFGSGGGEGGLIIVALDNSAIIKALCNCA